MPVTIALIAPLAFAMRIPFPVGFAYLAKESIPLIPWAWSITVISAILFTLIAIDFGFAAVTFLALVFYMMAFIVFPNSIKKYKP